MARIGGNMRAHEMTIPILIAGATAFMLCLLGGLTTRTDDWYETLRKSALQPPGWLFGPAWALILAMAATAAVLAWNGAADPVVRSRIVVAFAINAVLHALWSPIFFRLRRPDWALGEMGLLWLSIAVLVAVVSGVSMLGAQLLVPYLAWVSFALWLNLAIVRLNGSFRTDALRER